MTYPVVPDVPAGNITVPADLADHVTPSRYLVINADGSVLARLYVGATAVPTPADAVAITGLVPALESRLSDATHATPSRVANVFKAFNAQALSASSGGTPTVIWTPATGKKFRLLGYWFSLSAATGLVFHDLAAAGSGGVMPVPSPVVAANGIASSPPLGLGFLSALAGNNLYIDAVGAATVTGYVWGTEE